MSNFTKTIVVQGANQTTKRNGRAALLFGELKAKGETAKINYDKSVETACWSFDAASNVHQIKVGMTLSWKDFQLNASTRACERKQRLFVNRVVWHETAHARFTHDLSDPVSAKASRLLADTPFSIWNLFEDCFIEYQEWKRTSNRFGWCNFVEQGKPSSRAVDLLYELKKREAGSKSGWGAYMQEWLGVKELYYKRKWKTVERIITDFYKRAIDPKTDRALLANEWVKFFGTEEPQAFGLGKASSSDANASGNPSGRVSNGGSKPQKEVKASEWNWKEGDLTQSAIAHRDAIASQFAPIVRNGAIARRVNSSSGSRLNLAQAAIGGEQSFKRLGKVDGKRKIIALIDQSGSMNSHWNKRGGKELVSALRKASEMGLADIQIIFSATSKNADMSHTPPNELLKMTPRSEGEGLAATCRKYAQEILQADVAIVYTDAQIADGDFNLKPLRDKTHVIGCCLHETGSSDYYGKELRQHFPSVILRDSASGLARAIATSIANS